MASGRWWGRLRDVATLSRSPSASLTLDPADSTVDPIVVGPEPGRPRFLYLVAPQRLDLFLKIRRRFLDDDSIVVLLDRRTQDRRIKSGPRITRLS
jgi:hypothetical protein